MTGRFVHARRLSFGDTDAARIVYTPRAAHFAVEAVEAWMLERLGISWLHLVRDQGMGTPCVHMDVDFRSPMTPPDVLETEVVLTEAGRSSLGFRITGRCGARLCWEGRFVFVFFSQETNRAAAIPDTFRAAIARELAAGTTGETP